MALSFAEKNRLLVKHKNPEYFYTDLELFKKLYPGHKLNNDLANVTAFSKVRLSEQMLLLLLDKASIDEIQSNRGIDPPRELTYDEKVEKVLSKYGESYIIKNTADLKDIASMLGHPEPESLSSYVTLVGKPIADLLFDPEDNEDGDVLDDENLDNDPNSLKSMVIEHNAKISSYIEQYGLDHVFESKEDVEDMFKLTLWPMPDPQDENQLKLDDLIGRRFGDLAFSKPVEFTDSDLLTSLIKSIYLKDTGLHYPAGKSKGGIQKDLELEKQIGKKVEQIDDILYLDGKKESEKEVKKEVVADKKKETKAKNSSK